MPLSDAACRNAKPKEKPYKLSDEKALYLEVMPTGAKYWRMKYRIDGKELRDMGHRIDTIRQAGFDDYGRKHPAVALYVLVEGRKCA